MGPIMHSLLRFCNIDLIKYDRGPDLLGICRGAAWCRRLLSSGSGGDDSLDAVDDELQSEVETGVPCGVYGIGIQ
jgi:hypothetical protein